MKVTMDPIKQHDIEALLELYEDVLVDDFETHIRVNEFGHTDEDEEGDAEVYFQILLESLGPAFQNLSPDILSRIAPSVSDLLDKIKVSYETLE